MRPLPPVVFLVVVCTAALVAQSSSSFSRDDFRAADAARAIAVADFNRDGWLDTATAGTGRNSIVIQLNDERAGDGFRAGVEVVVGGAPFQIAAGDLNRDAIPDLAIANAGLNAVTLLIGTGNGSFRPKRDVSVTGEPRGIALADIDGDGSLDVLVTRFAANAWQVLYGDGEGGIERTESVAAAGTAPHGIAAADLDHDGRLEVIVAFAGSAGLRTFDRQADGSWLRRSPGGATYLNVLVTADFNRDGWTDVAAASTTRSVVAVYLGAASGLRSAATYATGASPRGIDAGDVNHDGTIDLVTANRVSSTVSVLHGRPTAPGTFAAAQEVAAGQGARDAALADFDRDGRTDIATANEYGDSTTVLTNAISLREAGFAFTGFESFGEDGSGVSSEGRLLVEDFDHSGRPDVAVIGSRSIVVRFNGANWVDLGVSPRPSDIVSADFDGDGHTDILATFGTFFPPAETSRLYRGDGRGGFSPTPAPAVPATERMLAADVNRDGHMDVIARWNGVLTLLGRGDGTFVEGSQRGDVATSSMAVGDVNRDGVLDLVSVYVNWRGFTVLPGDGSGGWLEPQFYSGLAENTTSVALGDFNEDGVLDVVTAGFHESVSVYAGRPDGTFGEERRHRTVVNGRGTAGYKVAVGDLDANGHDDIVTYGSDILFGRGDGTFRFAAFALAGSDPTVADYNADGLPDVLFTRDNMASVSVLQNRRTNRNLPPVADAGTDVTIGYIYQNWDEYLFAYGSSDPDAHEITYQWRDENGTLLGTTPYLMPVFLPGRHPVTLTVFDGRGRQASETIVVTVTPFTEVVTYASSFQRFGAWQEVDDESAASGVRVQHPNAGAPKLAAPLANPVNYIEYQLPVDPTQTYKLWIRGKAERNHWSNDSVFVQFGGATDTSGRSVYQLGSTSALSVNLEECSNCGLSGWGWEDDGWGAVNRNGVLLRFPTGGATIRIQTREDGISLDQIVLSSDRYLNTRPGTAKNDNTILTATP